MKRNELQGQLLEVIEMYEKGFKGTAEEYEEVRAFLALHGIEGDWAMHYTVIPPKREVTH